VQLPLVVRSRLTCFLRLDLHEGADNTLTATFELPGLKKEDVSIEVHDNRLVVSGQASTESEQKPNGPEGGAGTWVVRERRFGKFSRTLELPAGTKVSDFNASWFSHD